MRIGVLTTNFRVYYRLLNILKGMNVNFYSLVMREELENFDIIFSDERLNTKNCYVTDGTNEYWIKQMITTGPAREITIGIDPGPNPGIAALSDGKVLDSRNLYKINEVLEYVTKIRDQCSYGNLKIKIGNGDSANRDKIIRMLSEYELEIIKEDGSSKSIKRGRDWEAAIKIASSNNIVGKRNRKIK